MKRILIIFLVFLSISVFGQNHFLGIYGGINSSTLKIKSTHTSPIHKNITCGITYENQIMNHFKIGADLFYNKKGFSDREVFYTNIKIYQDYEYISTDFSFDNLSLQLKGGYTFGRRFCGFINLGIVPSYLLSSETTIRTKDEDLKLNITNEITKFNLAGLIEIGCNFNINNKLNLFSTLSYRNSPFSMIISDYCSFTIYGNYGTTLSFGLKYRL